MKSRALKIIFLVASFSFFTTNLKSQQAYRITYKHSWPGGRNDFETVLVFNDSAAFHFTTSNDFQDPFQIDSVYGAALIHHGLFYDNVTKSLYDQVNSAKGEKFMIKRSFDHSRWKLSNDKPRKIMGFLCKEASYDYDNLKMKAWYTEEIPHSFGPYYCFGLPGLVLQVKIPANDRLLKASKIEKGEFKIVIPKEGEVISVEEFRSRKNNQGP